MAEVATHELGHTLGFGHSTDWNATMAASAHFDGRCGSLRTDDLAAINFVYPSGLTPTPSPSRTPAPPTATVGTPPTSTPTRTFTAPVPSATASATRSMTSTRSSTPTRTLAPPTQTATSTVPFAATTPTARPRHRVRGHVQYYSSARGVPDVTVSLHGEMEEATLTTDAGDYVFDGVPSGTWELVAEKASGFGDGVSPLDAAYVLQYVANLRRFDSSQRLACDVTGDGQVSALDAARILQFSVGTLSRLPVGDTCDSDWSFVPDPAATQERSVVEPSIEAGSCNGGKIMLEDLLGEAPDQDFRAILFGDCTGNWDGDAGGSVEAPLGRGAMARASRIRLGRADVRGDTVRLPVYVRAPAPYNALDLQVAYDPERLTPSGVALRRPGDSGLTSFHAVQAGSLRVAMASGEPIKRRFGVLLQLEFTLANGMAEPGAIQALSAKVDELPATIAGDGMAR
jgi:hypothetical protein